MKSSLLALALISSLATTSLAAESIECLGAKDEDGWQTHVLLTPDTKATDGSYFLVVSQKTSVSTGYMAGHGGLGISNGNSQDLWLYTGFSKNSQGDAAQVGSLTQKNLGLDKLEVSCDYDDTLKFPEELPAKILCVTKGPGSSVVGADIRISKDSRTLQVMVANRVKPSISTLKNGTRLFAAILSIRGAKEAGIVAIPITSANKGQGMVTFGYEADGEGYKVNCELKNK